MNQSEFLQVTMRITELCSSPEYRRAFLMLRRQPPAEMAKADKSSDEYASLRLLIGTWDRIAIWAAGFNAKQKPQFFRSHPVSLIWQRLEPATRIIRSDIDERFAKDFENLHGEYQKWTSSKDGQQYRTAQQQAITALFFA